MGAGEEEDAIAPLALAEEESASALKVRVFRGAIERPRVGVKGLRSAGMGSRKGLKPSILGPETARVTMDSRKPISMPSKPASASKNVTAAAAVFASS